MVCLAANGFIWGSSLLILLVSKPVYTSSWALILPGSVNAVNVNLPEIGQAMASSGSAGAATSTFDPRANYEVIFTSEQVLRSAADKAGIPPDRFAKPRIRNIDNTTMMELEVTGPDPKDAQRRSYALYNAFLERLNQLRLSEIQQRDVPTQKILLETQAKLEDAQRKVSAYKLKSGLSSLEQVDTLSSNIEQLRRQRAELAAQKAQAQGRLQQLAGELDLSPAEAADAFKLQADQIFQQTLKDYSEASATIKVQSSKFGPNHPRIVKEVKRRDAAEQALQARAREVLGRKAVDDTLTRLALTSEGGSGRDTLFQDLVTAQTQSVGAQAQLRAIDGEISGLEDRLQKLAQQQSTLESLSRNEQIAEAVFASTLAKLDLGQADIFAAFPLIQIAVEPSLPQKPSAPKTKLILLGAAVGSVLVTGGLSLLWLRKPWVGKLSRWISP
jgi:uncharacterized protein involved in exopolysaccharide biosynthesis